MGGLRSNKEYSFGHKLKTGSSKADLMRYYVESEEGYAKKVKCLIRLGTLKLEDLKPDQKPTEEAWQKVK